MPTQSESIDPLVLDMFTTLQAPGLICALTSKAQVLHYSTHGHANVALKTPMSIDQSFPIGSLTKSFSAAAILLLRDQGLLTLDQSPADFVSGLDPFWANTSLHQLLSMQSGLGADYGGSWAEQHLRLSNTEMGERLALPVIAATTPGTAFLYSNFGYMMLGRVISQVSGHDARDFILEKFIKPLGMTNTGWAPPATNTMTGYRSRNGTFEEEETFSTLNDGGVFIGLWSTVPDMAIWIDFLCNANDEGDSRYDRLLRRASRREMQRATVLLPIAPPERNDEASPCAAYGYGLVNLQGDTEWTVGHGGAVPGFGAHMRWSPQTGVSVFAVANLRYADLSAGCTKVLSSASRVAQHRRGDMIPIVAQRANELLSLIATWDDEAANTLFAENVFIDWRREEILERLSALKGVLERSPTVTVVPVEGLSAKIVFGEGREVTFTVSTLQPGPIQEVVFL